MKIDPINQHERTTILAEVGERGKWRARRGGAIVSILRYQSPNGCRIVYSLQIGQRAVSESATALHAALDRLNALIADHNEHDQTPASTGRTYRDPTHPGAGALRRRRSG